jgi:hypothetical protein
MYSLTPMNAPQLRRLSLFNPYVPFNARTLVALRLGFPDISHYSHHLPTAPELLHMLHSCAQLQELVLQTMIPPDVSYVSHPTMFPPALTSLNVSDSFSRVTALRSHIKAPSASYMSLLKSITGDLQHQLDMLGQHVKSTLGPSMQIQLMSAHAPKEGDDHLFVALSTALPPAEQP